MAANPTRSLPRVASFCVTAALLTVSVGAQEWIHYRFDGDCGTEVFQLGGLPVQGTLVSDLAGAPGSSRVPGRFGPGLAGGSGSQRNQVQSGWNPGTYNGAFSVGFFARFSGTGPSSLAWRRWANAWSRSPLWP